MAELKCVIVGDGAVGKTSLLMSYTTDTFQEDHIATVFDTYTMSVNVGKSQVFVSLVDTAGQEDYDALRLLAYQDCHVVIVCFSISNPDSLSNVETEWIPELKKHRPGIPIVLAGTKSDLRKKADNNSGPNAKQMVNASEGQEVCKKVKAVKYIECSSLARENVKTLFDEAFKAGLKITPAKKFCSIL